MHWTDQLKKQARDIEGLQVETQKKLDLATEALTELARGEWFSNHKNCQVLGMKDLAARRIMELAKMPQRKKPSTWYF